jgi:protein-disulfide isomerase
MLGVIFTKGDNTENKITTKEKTTQTEAKASEVSESDHVRGNYKTAEVVIVEYSDTECPFCKNFHYDLQNIMNQYGNKVAWVYRHFPIVSLHSKAPYEARATECAALLGGNDGFWSYLDTLFENTPSNNGLDEKMLPIFAKNIGLDVDEFNTCLSDTSMDEKVLADYSDGIKAGVQGTPHTILILRDGTQIPILGADIETLKQTLEIIFS